MNLEVEKRQIQPKSSCSFHCEDCDEWWSLLVCTNRGFGGLHDNLMVDLHWLVRVFETFPGISIWDIELQDAILNAGVGYIWPPESCNNMHIIMMYKYTMTASTTRIEIKFVKPLLNSTTFYQIQHTLTFLLLLLCMAMLCRRFSLEVLLENGNFNFIAIACCRPGARSRSESKRGKDVTWQVSPPNGPDFWENGQDWWLITLTFLQCRSFILTSKLRFLSQVALLRVVFKALLQVLAW